MVWQMNFEDDPFEDDGTYVYEEEQEPQRCMLCHERSFECCHCCGMLLCPLCFSSQGGLCLQEGCLTEERLAAMEEDLRGEETP